MTKTRKTSLVTAGLIAMAGMVYAHGDVAPQPINTDALPDVGEEWLIENPYRAEAVGEEVWLKAVEIGSSGYNQNCARCHGLGAISGGLAPDLRFLEAEEYGDDWFMQRFQHGYTQNGTTKMPAFGEILGQKAGWAIRTYIETRPDDQMVTDQAARLTEIRDALAAMSTGGAGDEAALQSDLQAIAEGIETLSGAPVAVSIAWEAARALNGAADGQKHAAEILTVGLSAAH